MTHGPIKFSRLNGLIRPSRKEGRNGSIIIVILIALVSMGSMFYVASEYQGLSKRRKQFNQLKFGADAVYNRVMVLIYNDQSWEATAGGDPCMIAGVGCAAGAGGTLILKDARGDVYIDPTDVNYGLNREAKPCDPSVNGSFDPIDGNSRCPYRYDLSWAAVNCGPSKCDIQVTGVFHYSPNLQIATMPFNRTRYSFETIRKKEDGSLQAACTSVGGVFDQVRLTCVPGPTSATICPNGHVLRVLVKMDRHPSVRLSSTPCPYVLKGQRPVVSLLTAALCANRINMSSHKTIISS